MIVRVVTASIVLLLTANLFGQQTQTSEKPGDVRPESESQRWLRDYYAKQAAKYEFFVDDARTAPMTFVEKPIFRWKQDNDWSGDVYVWTYQGRPQVVGCILASLAESGSRSVGHEFHSLAEKPLPRAKMIAGSWTPEPGCKLTMFLDGEEVAATAPLRLTQMRTLARGFTATMKVDEKDWELRYLPQPIYRYSAPMMGVIDGGLFAYVWSRGTDPELLMLLECREEKPKPRWYFSPVMFTTRPVRVTLKDREVWSAPGGGGWTTADSREPYQTFFGGHVKVPADQ